MARLTPWLPLSFSARSTRDYTEEELDPLLEDPERKIPIAERTKRYIELGKQWSEGHKNRMIKVPATEGGIGALEELVAAGVTINVTLIFSEKQYHAARDACWRGSSSWACRRLAS